MRLTFGQQKYPYDKNFLAISNYAMRKTITQPEKEYEMSD